jgi:hypothetical protein
MPFPVPGPVLVRGIFSSDDYHRSGWDVKWNLHSGAENAALCGGGEMPQVFEMEHLMTARTVPIGTFPLTGAYGLCMVPLRTAGVAV